jgi:hypothetical protein
VLSVIYLVSYVRLSLPAIIAGVVVASTGSLEFTTDAATASPSSFSQRWLLLASLDAARSE